MIAIGIYMPFDRVLVSSIGSLLVLTDVNISHNFGDPDPVVCCLPD
jgi:hypothetical protein